MSKLTPKISAPPAPRMPNLGGHTDGVQKGGHARGGALAQPGRSVGMGNPQGRMPLQSPPTNVTGRKIGQPVPETSAAATKKPNRKGGANFYGDFQ